MLSCISKPNAVLGIWTQRRAAHPLCLYLLLSLLPAATSLCAMHFFASAAFVKSLEFFGYSEPAPMPVAGEDTSRSSAAVSSLGCRTCAHPVCIRVSVIG